MAATRSIGCVFQMFTLAVLVRQIAAAPLDSSSCKGAVQPDGTVTFQLPDDFTDLIRNCEPELVIEDIVCAIYGNKTVPATWISPVLGATTHNFTLSYCPQSVKIGLFCSRSWSITCSCVPPINTVQNQSSTTQPPAELNLPRTPHNGTHYRVGLIIFGGVLVIVFCVTLAWIAFRGHDNRKRMKDIECSLRGSSAETSASSSSEKLPGPQNPTETAPIMNHDEHGGT